MPKKYLRVSALILPHEREAYAAYRMQPKRESCAALYQALRENMATLEQAAKIPNFRRKKGQAGIAVRLYLELLDEYRDVINYVFLERCKVCVAELIKEAALFGTVSWTEAKAQAWLAQIDMRPFISPCLGKPRPDALFQDKNLVTLASIMKEDLTPAVQGVLSTTTRCGTIGLPSLFPLILTIFNKWTPSNFLRGFISGTDPLLSKQPNRKCHATHQTMRQNNIWNDLCRPDQIYGCPFFYPSTSNARWQVGK